MVGFGCDSDGEISIDMRDLLIKLSEAQRLNLLFVKPLIPAFGSSKSPVAIHIAAQRQALAAVGEGLDLPSKRKILKATKTLEKRAAHPPSAARIVRRACAMKNLAFYKGANF